ncbi:MAG TPA: RHS repeat-associated core domain-containing protein [Polyangiaceae bacterium]
MKYGYDFAAGAVNEVDSVPNNGMETPVAYWKLLQADEGIRPKLEQFGNGLQTTRAYGRLDSDGNINCSSPGICNVPGELSSIITATPGSSESTVQNVNYTYDQNGNVTQVNTASDPNVLQRNYTYDGFDRLTLEDTRFPVGGGGQGETANHFSYDLGGNQTDSGHNTYTNPTRPYQITFAANAVTYGYDANGNQTDRNDPNIASNNQHRDFDRLDMPWHLETGAGTSGFTTELEYDGSGARILKRKLNGLVHNELCVSDPDACVAELTVDIGEIYEQVKAFGAGCDPKDAVAGTGSGACTPTQVTHNYRVYAGGKQVAQIKRVNSDDPTTSYLHDDLLGSTSAITDENGAVANTEKRAYSAFGEPQGGNLSSTAVLSGFTGLEHDADLGLINMRGRLYDPKLKRFISPDPFVMQPFNPQALNRYAYVMNNPLRFTDPSGFDGEEDTIPDDDPDPEPGDDDHGASAASNNSGSGASSGSISAPKGYTVAYDVEYLDPSGANITVGHATGYTASSSSTADGPTTIAQSTAAPASPESQSATAGDQGSPSGAPQSPGPSPEYAVGGYESGHSDRGSRSFAEPSSAPVPASNSLGRFGFQNLPPKDNSYPAQHIPSSFRTHLDPIFDHFHLNLSRINIFIRPLGHNNGQTFGTNIALNPNRLLDGFAAVLETLAHELTHTVQILHYGDRGIVDDREDAELELWGTDVYDVPEALERLSINQINPVDPRFTLEAIAARVGEIAEDALSDSH